MDVCAGSWMCALPGPGTLSPFSVAGREDIVVFGPLPTAPFTSYAPGPGVEAFLKSELRDRIVYLGAPVSPTPPAGV